MKKTLTALVLVLILGAGIWIGIFFWQNLRGISPAFEKSPQDITHLIPGSQQLPSQPESSTQQPASQNRNTTDMPLTLPEGFNISIYAKNLINPRVLLKDPNDVLLTSVTSEGKIIALPDADGDGVADSNTPVAEGLNKPHGMAFRCPDPNTVETCELYIGETDKVTLYRYDAKNLRAEYVKKIVDLPSDGGHFTRTLMFQKEVPDDQLLIAVGSSCNVCAERDERRAKIMVISLNTGEMKPYATGLRNSVFMTHDPFFSQIYATEMGRDRIGDDIPPDEINRIEEGKNYGWPVCYGQNVHDTDYDRNTYIRNPCMEPFETPALVDLQAHSAPLGLAFFPVPDSLGGKKNLWPEAYRGNLLVADHGSWNRSIPTGYKVVMLKSTPDQENQRLTFNNPGDFITGWLSGDNKTALGRPVDILIDYNGILYISDDKAGVVYLLTYRE